MLLQLTATIASADRKLLSHFLPYGSDYHLPVVMMFALPVSAPV